MFGRKTRLSRTPNHIFDLKLLTYTETRLGLAQNYGR